MPTENVLAEAVQDRLRIVAEGELARTKAPVFVVRAVNDAGESVTLVCDRAKLFQFEFRLRDELVGGLAVLGEGPENASNVRSGQATIIDREKSGAAEVVAHDITAIALFNDELA